MIDLLAKIDSDTIAVIDGQFMPMNPNQMIATGNHKKNFNLLVSTVEDEGSYEFSLRGSIPQFTRNNPASLTKKAAEDFLFEILANNSNVQFDKNLISSVYYTGINEKFDDDDLLRRQTGIAYGDVYLGCPTLNFAKKIFKSSPDTVSVYQWHYKAKLGNVKEICSRWGGSCHTNDLYPFFGIAFRNPVNYHNRERELAREVMNVVHSFLRTG